ncbi:glycine zipper 2TM domain-containing protein [Vogesella sp. LIG4]|uniref:glycine zipper 2TM domain-containing protein n=1 Tax=Vogesella sp. LIG4 TaxID=1192162 RepID=UPI00082015CC|nr:glycine zipper 2TM domain-containing protein [Vogesella sp. LIG4]SCK17226.1 outer membrane lipoprotein SlyB [Vogesella sp. LIG4]
MSRLRLTATLSLLSVALLAGCTSMYGSDSAAVYSQSDMRQIHDVEYGKVLDVKSVRMEGSKNDLLTLGGTALGGIAGSSVGQGKGSAAGAIVGAMIGGVAAEGMQRGSSKAAYELTIQTDKGRTISIVQEADVPISAGQRVKILSGNGTARVLPM